MRLRFALALLALLAAAPIGARGDEVVMRGNYWRDRNTRVVAPEVDFSKELPSGTIIGGSYLLDAITSASASAGAMTDEPFTEFRNQVALRVGQRLGPVTATVNYRYSSESDYWAHVGGASLAVDLFQKNTTLALTYQRSHSDVGRRAGATGFVPIGHLDSDFLILGVSQVLTSWLFGDLTYEYDKIGDKNDPRSFQANPYRMVRLGGTPTYEFEPRQRDRHMVSAGLRLAVPGLPRPLRHLVFYAKYRLYTDSWSITAHTPELRTYIGVGPIELRATGRYYTQSAASFYPRDAMGRPLLVPEYADKGVAFGQPNDPNHCLCYTGDSKLSAFSSFFFELRLAWQVPLGRFLGDTTMAVSYGHYINNLFAHIQYGDAEVLGTELIFPF